MTLARRLAAEGLGTGLLLATVVGPGGSIRRSSGVTLTSHSRMCNLFIWFGPRSLPQKTLLTPLSH